MAKRTDLKGRKQQSKKGVAALETKTQYRPQAGGREDLGEEVGQGERVGQGKEAVIGSSQCTGAHSRDPGL